MNGLNNLIRIEQFEHCSDRAVNESKGNKKFRLKLDNTSLKANIAACKKFIDLIYLIDCFCSALGGQRKWIKIDVRDEKKGKTATYLLNVNSICKRTMLTKETILLQSPAEVSNLFAQYKPNTSPNTSPNTFSNTSPNTSPNTSTSLSSTLSINSFPNIEIKEKKLKNFFPHAFLINMATRQDRIDLLERHLESIDQSDFKFEIMPAVIGKDLPASEIERMSKSAKAQSDGRDDRAGRLGVLMSQLKAVKTAKDRNYPQVLIMEDDIRFRPDYFSSSYAQKAFKELPENWGILFLGHYDDKPGKRKDYSEHLVQPGCPYDCHAWMINASMYDTVINALEEELKKENGQMRALDVVIGGDLPETGRVFAIKKNIAIQDEGPSSIAGQYVRGNYQNELKELKENYPDILVNGKKTLDNMPVKDPLIMGTLYQMTYHIDQIFKKYGIEYAIEGGTILGARRHKGLIPWDDDVDLFILPGEEEKLKNPEVQKDLEKVGLTLVDHWVGKKIGALKEHPLGKTHLRGKYTIKTPNVDIFFTEQREVDGEIRYYYKTKECLDYWPKHYHTKDEIYDKDGKRNRVKFGPLQVDNIWNPEEYCYRQYGSDCLTHGYLQYDHINETPIRGATKIVLGDKRAPAYKPWEGIAPANFSGTC